jgi:hypothetical protein
MKALIDSVRATSGNLRADSLAEVLFSLMWKSNITHYHTEKSKEAINKLLGEHEEADPTEIVDLILEQAAGSEKGREFFEMQFISEANLIACAQSLHSMADIFGQAVYITLDLDTALPKPINEKRRYLAVINDELKKAALVPSLTAKIDELLLSRQFVYLKDYMNVTKHRALVRTAYSVSFKAEASHGMKISDFKYEDRAHAAKWSNDFFDKDVSEVIEMIVGVGVEMNNVVGIS